MGGASCGLFAYFQVAYDIWAEGVTVLFVFCEVTLTFVGVQGLWGARVQVVVLGMRNECPIQNSPLITPDSC